LLAYLLPRPRGWSVLLVPALLSGLVLAGTGTMRPRFVNRTSAISALEMLSVGILAGLAAYLVGVGGSALLNGR
jgi:VIT1/CCC1 family predicted Fe2+/Mn2+ transporter